MNIKFIRRYEIHILNYSNTALNNILEFTEHL